MPSLQRPFRLIPGLEKTQSLGNPGRLHLVVGGQKQLSLARARDSSSTMRVVIFIGLRARRV
jgi:hypothetical protein